MPSSTIQNRRGRERPVRTLTTGRCGPVPDVVTTPRPRGRVFWPRGRRFPASGRQRGSIHRPPRDFLRMTSSEAPPHEAMKYDGLHREMLADAGDAPISGPVRDLEIRTRIQHPIDGERIMAILRAISIYVVASEPTGGSFSGLFADGSNV